MVKVGKMVQFLEQLHYSVAPAKSKYLLVSKDTVYLEPLRVEGLLVIRLKLAIRWLGY